MLESSFPEHNRKMNDDYLLHPRYHLPSNFLNLILYSTRTTLFYFDNDFKIVQYRVVDFFIQQYIFLNLCGRCKSAEVGVKPEMVVN